MTEPIRCTETYRGTYECDLDAGHDGPHECMAGRWHA